MFRCIHPTSGVNVAVMFRWGSGLKTRSMNIGRVCFTPSASSLGVGAFWCSCGCWLRTSRSRRLGRCNSYCLQPTYLGCCVVHNPVASTWVLNMQELRSRG